jgi:hypothetical protein
MGVVGSVVSMFWLLLFSGGFVWFEESFNGVVVVGSVEVLVVEVVVTYGGVLLLLW